MKMDDNNVFDSVEDCIADCAAGKFVIVCDDENRENEGDLIIAAEKMTPAAMNVMVTHARGLVCVPTTSERLVELGIDDMVRLNRDKKGTAFTVTVDAATGVSTGISAADRARTVRLLGDPSACADAFVSPGHVNPLRARPGGVLERAGHTEAAVDLTRLAGMYPCAAICEIMNDDGSMARLPDLIEFKRKHGYRLMTVASLINYRLKFDSIVRRIFSRKIDTEFGEFDLIGYRAADKETHFALVKGQITQEPTYARVHSENIFADLFCAKNFPRASNSFAAAMKTIAEEGRGALVYVSRENSGVLCGDGSPSLPSFREYGTGSQILRDLGFKKIKLLTGNPGKHMLSEGFGLEIVSETKLED